MTDEVEPRANGSETSAKEPGARHDPQLALLEELVDEHATVAGDILEIDAHTWAIHGTIAMDGEVIIAEYDTEAQARIVLDELSSTRPAEDG